MTDRVPHIAVVDDDASVRHSIERLLRSLGYDVSAHASAEGFLRSLQLTKTSCLVLDIQMPNFSGLDLQGVVSALRSPIPIIFITAYRDDKTRARALANGAVGFLEKPFDDDELVGMI